MKGLFLALALALAAPAAAAQNDAVAVARAALERLEEAGRQLQDAEGASDRVAALTAVIRAYETGLTALREGLRQAAIREAALIRGLDAESARLARLLGALETMEPGSESLLLMHPGGPLATVRAGLLLSSVTPELQARVTELRTRLDDIRVIRVLQESALDTLGEALRGVQEARTQLSLAISNRTDLPPRFAEDEAQIARLLESTDTLAAFAEGLAGLAARGDAPAPEARATALPLPVDGRLLRRFQENDAAGIARPGWLIAAAPRALVTTPVTATIRYVGPLLDYGNVMILEPDPDTLMVLAGLGQVYGAAGDILPAGAPVGLMGGDAPASEEFLTESAENGGAGRTETLYLELRQGRQPVDPAVWFAATKDETR